MPGSSVALSFTVVSSVAFLADLWVLLAGTISPAPARRLGRGHRAVMRSSLGALGRMLGQAGRQSDPGCDSPSFPVNIRMVSLRLPRQKC